MHRAILVFFLWAGCAGSLVVPVFAQVIRVPQDHPGVAEALSAAPDGAEVHVAAGTWDVRGIAVAGRAVKLFGAGSGVTVLSGGGVARGFHLFDGARLEVHGLTIRDCAAGQSNGGAFLVEAASLRILECTLQGNTAVHGAGVFMTGAGEVLVEGSEFVSNSANVGGGHGGAIFAAGGGSQLRVEGALFRENSAAYQGGAIAAFTACRFNNCVFDRNAAAWGGAVETYHVGNLLTFTNCTFVDNYAGGAGAAVFSYYGDIRLVNCALRGPDSMLTAVYGGSFHGAGCVMSSGTLAGHGNITADPQIGPDYVPLPTSPCIDAGVPHLIATRWPWGAPADPCAVVDRDYLGNPRWRDDPAADNRSCHLPRTALDVGAVERGGLFVQPPVPADLNDDGAVDGDDLGTLLAAWDTPDCASDLNADGVVEGLDLGILLSRWGCMSW